MLLRSVSTSSILTLPLKRLMVLQSCMWFKHPGRPCFRQNSVWYLPFNCFYPGRCRRPTRQSARCQRTSELGRSCWSRASTERSLERSAGRCRWEERCSPIGSWCQYVSHWCTGLTPRHFLSHFACDRQASQVITVRPSLPSWHAAKNHTTGNIRW